MHDSRSALDARRIDHVLLPPFDDASRPKVLLARFHPSADSRESILVGRVVCEGEEVWIEPVIGSRTFAITASMLAKLRYLIGRCSPHVFRRLPLLRSRFWSFIEDAPPGKEPDA